MGRPTTLRSKRIGNWLGTVVSITLPFKVWFQLYRVSPKYPDGHYLAATEIEFDTEQEAFDRFEAWKKEAELLKACGDM